MGMLVTQEVCCGIVDYEDVIGGREGVINEVLRGLQLLGMNGNHDSA